MPFADELLGRIQAEQLVDILGTAAGDARLASTREAAAALDDLALGRRAELLATSLLGDLDLDYPAFASVTRRALESEELTGWMLWPLANAVAASALADGSDAAFDDGMQLLAELTHRLTCEWSIRAFLRARPDRALAIMTGWTSSDDEHIRRLASEGTRAYLPWGVRVRRLTADPELTRPILDALYRDESEYVRRSVANHLNDVSRHDPAFVTAVAAAWLQHPDANTQRVVRHAMRTLVKKGDAAALALLGFGGSDLAVDGPRLDRAELVLGGELTMTGSVRNDGEKAARIVVDYVVHHVKANGTTTAKAFKLVTTTLEPGEVLQISKVHPIKPITTRRYHAGMHAIELQVNGERHGRSEFRLSLE